MLLLLLDSSDLVEGISDIGQDDIEGSVLEDITAGTVQPKPMSIGTILLPERPIFLRSLSITKATRAM